jgi:hypothetical protein
VAFDEKCISELEALIKKISEASDEHTSNNPTKPNTYSLDRSWTHAR